ncbi:hypothetical protein [Pseudomonas sp. B15(2017)]|uniref:hypothetical protein n=1 Tax=Pseudomonas sp. B15(2017) TaxID=1981744 RepID=UPI000A1E49C6|nr:hypothetical protein [Pseudomonas sp. B15(2017)]
MKGRPILFSAPLLFALVVLGFLLMLLSAVEHERQLDAYVHSGACKKVGEATGNLNLGYGSTATGPSAIVTTATLGKTAWLCDDGVTYWR